MTVGSNIKKARGNMKQADLADILGVDVSTVSRWENDKNVPISSMLKKIADALNTSTVVLLSDDTALSQDSANEIQTQNSTKQNADVLFLKDGEHEISVPDTEENRLQFWNVVKQIFNSSSQINLNILNGQKNQYSLGDIKVENRQ